MSLFRKLESMDENKIRDFNENIFESNKNNTDWKFIIENTNLDSKIIIDNLEYIDILDLIKKSSK